MREALSSVDPPKELHERVLAAVAKEKRRARRHSLYRRAGVIAAAALILVPAVTLPIFRLSRHDEAPSETKPDVLQDGVLYDDAFAEDVQILFSTFVTEMPTDGISPAETEKETASHPSFSPPPAQTTVQTACSTAVSSKVQSEALPDTACEPAYFAVLRELVGEEAFSQWLAAYEGDPASPAAEAAAYDYFGVNP